MIVLKPFTTSQRRFLVGAEVSASDDFGTHSFAALKARGFIGDAEPAKAVKVTASPKAED